MRNFLKNSPALQKARSRQGFTLVELLVTMIIVIMASAVVTQALTFSYKVYLARTGDAEAQLLCQTVSLLAQDDLTKTSYLAGALPSYADLTNAYNFYAGTDLKSMSDDSSGTAIEGDPIKIGSTELLPAWFGYGNGAMAERTVSIEVKAKEDGVYPVTVSVTNRGSIVATNQFTVWPLR